MLWRRYLLVGCLIVAAYPFLPPGLWQDLAYLVVGLSGVTAIEAGVRLHRPAHAAPWHLMAIGQLLWVIGDGVSSWNEDISHLVTFPSAADVFYLAAYPVLAGGLVLLIRSRRRHDLAGWLDSGTVTVGLGLLSWVLVAQPTMTASQQSFAAAAVGVAYPIADILLAGLLIRLVATVDGRAPALYLLLAAVTLLIAGDTTSAALSLFTSSQTNAFDVIWLSSYVVWGAAALHPSMRLLSEPAHIRITFTPARLAALALSTLIAPMILAFQRFAGLELDVWPVVIGSTLLFSLVVGRMLVAMNQTVLANRDREVLQEELAYQAAHDSLTRLPNRAEAVRLILGALHRARRTGALVGLLFIDLDGFKAVNDAFGHRAGDDVLRAVAERFGKYVRGGDVLARLGGDEFVVLLETLDTQSSAVTVAHRLLEAASVPIVTGDGHEVRVGASIGVAVSQDGAVEPDRLMHEADTAAYRAKAAGRGRVEVFDSVLRRTLAERSALESAIMAAIRDDELAVYYQPIIELRTGRVQGHEALARWHRPDIGVVAPADFVPLAEESNLICDLDAWVLGRAVRQLAAWTSRDDGGGAGRTMAVNISGRSIGNRRILQDVALVLRESGVSPSQVIIEITETVLTDDPLVIHHLQELRKMGVLVGIDHFGTGYNSIARLQDLPIDIIKIDRSFLDRTRGSADQVLQLLINSAHAFGLPVIAEGVETVRQIQDLKSMNCESAQGFYFARPMKPADAEAFMVRQSLTAPPTAP